MWLASIEMIFQREKEIALKVLKYSARMLCRVGMNVYKNNSPGPVPAPGSGASVYAR